MGRGAFAATLKTLGSQTITATDTVTATITGTSNAITVSAGTATHFAVTAPATATAGASFNYTVTAQDAQNNTVDGLYGHGALHEQRCAGGVAGQIAR